MVLGIVFNENLALRLNIKLDAHTDTLLVVILRREWASI